MSKRYIPLLSQAAKKPRIDVAQTSKRKLSIQPKEPEPPKENNIDHFFDDDDDDDLLFATQKIEASVLDFSAITFTEFQHGVKASTQVSQEEEEKKEEEVIKQDLEDFFMDDDDEWANLEATIDLMPPPSAPAPSVQAAKQKESSTRIQYLQDRVQEFTSQNTQLQVNAEEFKDKLQCKEGEVTNLREQLKQIKRQLDSLRLEKVQECESIRQKYTQEVHDLKKKLDAEKTDMKFKENEISRLKIKCLDESQRFNASVVEHGHKKVPKNLFKMSLKVGNFESSRNYENSQEIFEDCLLRKTHYSVLVNKEFVKLRNSFQVKTSVDSIVFCSFKKVLESFPPHFELVDKATVNWKDIDYGNLFSSKPIYSNEKEMQLRRFVALVSIFCQQNSSLSEKIIELKELIFLILKTFAESFEPSAYLGVVESFSKLLIVLVKHYLKKSTPIVSETEDFLFDFLKKIVFSQPNDRVLKNVSEILNLLSQSQSKQQICSSLCQKTTLGIYVYDASTHTSKFREDTCLLQIYANFLEASFKDSLSRSDGVFEILKKICWNHGNFLLNCVAKCTDSVTNAPHWVVNRESSDVMSGTVSRQESDISQASVNSSAPTTSRSLNSFDCVTNEKAICRCYLKAVRSFIVVLYQLTVEWKRRRKERCNINEATMSVILKKSIDLLFYVLYMFQFDILNNYIKLQNTTRLRLVLQFFEDNVESLSLNEMQ
ncbi:hypothetical protein ACFFRR_003855, partial [Megaselia abdita]